jgi:hypothetical protein
MNDATYAGGPPPAGWYPDPDAPARARWWDGYQWYASQPPAVPARTPVARGLGSAVVVLLAVNVSVLLVEFIGEAVFLDRPMLDDGPGAIPVGLLVFSVLLSVVSVPALIATAVVWCIWQVRILTLVGATGIRRRPGWHVAAWMIPVGNLFLPLWNLQGLWRSAGLRGQGLLGAWWLTILAYWSLVVGAPWFLDGRGGDRRVDAATSLLALAGVVLAMLVVRKLTAAADSVDKTAG